MDNTSQQTQPVPTNLDKESSNLPKKSNFLTILLSVLLLITVGSTAFFAYQTQKLASELRSRGDGLIPAEPTPVSSNLQITPTPDPTSGWKTYANTVHGVSFRYPSVWVLTEKEGQKEANGETYNASIKLNKDNFSIGISLNMDGIGGGPRNVPVEGFSLWGKTFYKQYGDINFSTGTKRIDICDTPSGLGVFKVSQKTYMMSLTYPAIQEGEKPDSGISEEFDQILSTFQFAN